MPEFRHGEDTRETACLAIVYRGCAWHEFKYFVYSLFNWNKK